MSQIDITSLADKVTAIAFDLAAQATVDANIIIGPGGGQYDPATDTKQSVANFPIKGFFYQSFTQEMGQDAAKTATFLFRVAVLAAMGYSGLISEGDQVVIATVTWTVYRADPDPVNATWVLKIRR